MSSTREEQPQMLAQQMVPQRLQCPICQTASLILDKNSAVDGRIPCPGCGFRLSFDQATQLATYEENARAAWSYADHARHLADQWQGAAVTARREVEQSALPPPDRVQNSVTDSGPGRESPGAGDRSGVPTAVVLQGTGAVMILAAIVLVTAVAWTVLPIAGQAILLVTMVCILGALTIWARDRIPTTSLVLAVLTAAVYVVVAIGMPVLVTSLDFRWYPSVAAVLGSALMIVVGRLGRIAVWRHLGVAALPLAAILFAAAVFQELPDSNFGWTVVVILLAIQTIVLLGVADQQRERDAETAATAFWAAMTLGVGTGLAVVAELVEYLLSASELVLTDRLWAVVSTLTFVPVMWMAAWVWNRNARRGKPGMNMWWVAFAPVALAVLVTPIASDSWLVAVLPATSLLLVSGVAALLMRDGNREAKSWLVGLILLIAGPVAITGWLLLVDAVASVGGDWRWLTYLSVALVVGFGLGVVGDRTRSIPWVVVGWLVAVGAWTVAWEAGHLGSELESLTLPIALMTLGWGAAGQYRFTQLGRSTLWRPIVLWAAVAPIFTATWLDFADSGLISLEHLAVVVAAGLLGFWLGWGSRGNWTLAVGGASAGVLMFVEAALFRSSVDLLEAYTLTAGVFALILLTTASWEHLIHRRYLGLWAASAVVLVPSYLFALSDPHFENELAVARGVALLSVFVAVTATTWRSRRLLAAVAGSLSLGLLVWWYGWWLAGTSVSDVPEAWSIPLAVAATADIWFWLRTRTQEQSRELRGWLLAPGLGVLVVSTLASLALPAAGLTDGDTARVVIVLVAWWSIVVLALGRPLLAGWVAVIAVGLTWYQLVAIINEQYPAAALEAYTWSAALAIGAATALFLRIRPSHLNSMVTMAPTTTLVLLPTAILAWSAGETIGWRGWFVLVAGGALLLAGVRQKWAGAIVPALIGIGIIVIPILTKLSSELPLWVPLAAVGVVLLVVGARLESLRRRGRALTHWATSLR